MKRLFSLVSPHWRLVLLAAIAGGIVSAMNGALAFIVKDVVDDVFIAGDMRMLFIVSVGVLVAFWARGFFMAAQNIVMGSVGAKIVRDLRDKVFGHLIYLPMSHYGKDTMGSMMSKVINDIGFLDQYLVFKVKDLFLSITTIIVLTSVAFYRRWDLTLMAVVVLPFAFYFVSQIGRRLKSASNMVQTRLAHITESLTEGLGGIKVVKAFTMEEGEKRKFADKGQGYYREYMKTIRLLEASSLTMEIVGGLGVAFIIYYGGRLVATNEITSGEFMSFVAAIMMIHHPAKGLAKVHNGLQQARAYVERVDGILELEAEPEGRVEAGRLSDSLEFRDVSFSYDARSGEAITDVHMKVKKGEVIALVGKSGAGKTTLVDLIARFYRPDKGAILMDGIDINELTTRSLRSQIGMVSQNVVLFNGTLGENISYGVEGASPEQIRAAAEAAYAMSFINELPGGLDADVGEGGSLLSGGQRQRISIARAILRDPSILILDEATSALDTESEMMVQRALDELMEAAHSDEGGGKTVFVIAHRLSTIKRADRIVVMDRGGVVQSGSHEELLAHSGGLYSQLYRLQYGQDETVA